jgi:proteasome lid subunit RPN8/RPN11
MMNEPDIRLLASEGLPDAAFPGGRNEAFRVYFSPEVHAALWKHAGEDTSVEICGVLVGTWHRDEVGPFVNVAESIRGEGADTRFAEVTFTHQTWAKINAEMDTKFAHLKIVGWYHTHPDFGIFLSDRDRFIQEHFFSGPGQIAHVIDPVRRTEGVFIWRAGKPTVTDHFWVGDRILAGANAEKADSTGGGRDMAQSGPSAGAAPGGPQGVPDSLLPPPGRLIIYGCTFLVGYLLATLWSAWERQRFVEAELTGNFVPYLLRYRLSDELDALQRDLEAVVPPLERAQTKPAQADVAFGDARRQLAVASQRAGIIKATYGNTAVMDDLIRRLPIGRPPQEPAQDRGSSKPMESNEKATGEGAAPPSPPGGGPESKKS